MRHWKGKVTVSDSSGVRVRDTVADCWVEDPTSMKLGEWGGSFRVGVEVNANDLVGTGGTIETESRNRGEIMVKQVTVRVVGGSVLQGVIFQGTGPAPF